MKFQRLLADCLQVGFEYKSSTSHQPPECRFERAADIIIIEAILQ